MKKPKKAKQAKSAGAPSKDATSGSARSSLLGKLILPIVLGATSFCTVYFLPRPEPANASDIPSPHVAVGASQAAGEPIAPKIETSLITLEPFTVSLKGRARILRLSITIEAPTEMADIIDPKDPKLRDAFMGYLSALGMEQVEDAAFLVRLRAQLTRRAQFVLGAESVQGILITDFMVR